MRATQKYDGIGTKTLRCLQIYSNLSMCIKLMLTRAFSQLF